MNNYTALSGGSQFDDIIENIKKVDANIAKEIQERNQKLNQKESVQLVDKRLAQQINQLNGLITEGKTQINKMKNLSQNELQRQKNLLAEYQNRSDQFSNALKVKQIINAVQSMVIQQVITQPEKNYRDKSNTEMVQIQNNAIKQQDQLIDNMSEITSIIAGNSKTINLALKEDKQILKILDNNVQEATNEIKDTDSKLKTLLSYTNDWCLWVIILVEVVVFIFLVIN